MDFFGLSISGVCFALTSWHEEERSHQDQVLVAGERIKRGRSVCYPPHALARQRTTILHVLWSRKDQAMCVQSDGSWMHATAVPSLPQKHVVTPLVSHAAGEATLDGTHCRPGARFRREDPHVAGPRGAST